MGYWYMYGESDTGFQDSLKQFSNKLAMVEPNSDGSFEVEVTVRGATEERMSFKAQNIEELREMVDLNAGKMA
ncbi:MULTISPECIES: hypothetical protein [unclassified Sphingomonas]|uniref:hypothetical protein n=1 Tax=unclassified Sphingomonas TaxID=196159 RepID=UPI0003641798|nr:MULTISPECIES: hypothetical protein [unclassified Sphingomonas]KTF67888.1 hypothetical protein ATB93_16350 [Sphingomonas sp. WG]